MTDEEPVFTLRASDPASPFAILAYAAACRNKGADADFIAHVKAKAAEFYKWQDTHGVIELGKSVMFNERIDRMFRSTNAEGAAKDPRPSGDLE